MKNLLKELSDLNVKIDVVDGKLHLSGPQGVITAELKQQILSFKSDLIELLGGANQEALLPHIIPDLQNRHQPFPLNDVQYAYWIGRKAHFDLSQVSTHFYFELDCKNLNLARLNDAFNKVIRQHDMLRAITTGDGQQRVLERVPPYHIEAYDLSILPEYEREIELAHMRESQSSRTIASDRWPLFHITAAHLATGVTRLFLSWDFIFLDAWSILLIFKEWHICYENTNHVLAPLSLTFRDYVLAEVKLKELPAYQRAKQYWWNRLDHLPESPQLPLVHAAIGDSKPNLFKRRRFSLSAVEWQALKVRAGSHGITPTSALLAIFAEVLNSWSKTQHYCLNLTIFNRREMHEEVNAVVGDFTNLLILEVDGRVGDSFVERALRLQSQFLSDFDHLDISAIEVLRELTKRRNMHGRAVLPVVFTSTLMLNGSRSDDSSGLEKFGQLVWGISQTPQVWLDYQIFENDGGLVFNWDAIEHMFLPGVLDSMFAANQQLVESLSRDTQLWSDNQIVKPPRNSWTVGEFSLPLGVCLHSPFVTKALSNPLAVAIAYGDATITYGALLAHSNAIAQQLLSQGVMPNQLIAVVMEKSWEQIVAVMAIMIAGAAYLPIDPRWPKIRREQIFERCSVSVLLTQKSFESSIPESITNIVIAATTPALPFLTAAPPQRQKESDLAYVIFTSGSTGEPKGVMIDHRGAANTVFHINRLFNVAASDKVLAVSELSFDLSVYDIFGLLGVGGTLVIPLAEKARDPMYWRDLIMQHKISLWNSAPQLMGMLIDSVDGTESTSLASLRLVMMSGDWIPTRLPERIRYFAPQTEIISLGGATEGSIWSIYFPITQVDPGWSSIPYGKPLPNQQIYILNSRYQICPDQVIGDIYIGGAGVALGYWQDPERTRQRFITHPETAETLYWTGDLGRYLSDGNVEFLGREDSQVKLRGYRVELGEIAGQLQTHPEVSDASVQLIERGEGRNALVAYLVAAKLSAGDQANALSTDELTTFLAERLPEYMLPQRFIVCPSFPLSANGKLDVVTLLRDYPFEDNKSEHVVVPPKSELQARILAIWETVLGMEGLSVSANFFEAGGDSLLLTKVLRQLNEMGIRQLTMEELFTYPTVQSLSAYMAGKDNEDQTSPSEPVFGGLGDVAIIGMAGRFPDADNPDALWQILAEAHCATRHFTDDELLHAGISQHELSQPNYVKSGPVLPGLELFDAEYFGMPPTEAQFMDPQQRFLLECSSEALEHAGYVSEAGMTGSIGVFVGKGVPRYMVHHLLEHSETVQKYGLFTILNGQDKDHAATILSYKLNLTGPSISINTSCSTSLVAVHTACQSLNSGECEIALAGGVSFISTLERFGYLYEEGHIRSPDGYCRPFSDAANGTVFGSGAGIVVLKRLADALRDNDTIHAVIKGSAINNDGALKVGYTAPSVKGQAKVILNAQARAGVTPSMMGYIEAHGTGTHMGDPIEFKALREVFGGARSDGSKVVIGSIKSNIGHLDIAAGISSLIKVVMMLKHRKIPASLHAAVPNSRIDFNDSPFFINGKLRPWNTDAPRLAGVSSFGVGGTNAHVILAEAPERETEEYNNSLQLLPLSAKSPSALRQVASGLARHLIAEPNLSLASIALTLQRGRAEHQYRHYVVSANAAEAINSLNEIANQDLSAVRPVKATDALVFLLPGQGSQKHGCTAALYHRNKVFREVFDQCSDLVEYLSGTDLRTVLYGESDEVINQTAITQPLLFTLEYALARYWISLGVTPSAMLGHSLGEYVAACLADVFSLEEALSLVIVRGQLIQSLPEGKMLAVACQSDELMPILTKWNCALAAVNGPTQCVASGTHEQIEQLSQNLDALGIPHRILKASHAFHSAMMDPILEVYESCVSQVKRKAPTIPFISSVTGDWISTEQAIDPKYWTRHMRDTVRFSDGLDTTKRLANSVLLEVGPGNTLSKLATANKIEAKLCVATFGDTNVNDELGSLNHTIGRLWAHGVEIKWTSLEQTGRAGRVPLPTYPFERKRHWIPVGSSQVLASCPVNQVSSPLVTPSVDANQEYSESADKLPGGFAAPSNEIEMRLAQLWMESLGVERVSINDDFFSLGGDSLMVTRLYANIKKEFGVDLPRQKIFALATIKRIYLYIIASTDLNAVEHLTEEEINELQELISA